MNSKIRLQKLAGILSEARGDPGPATYEELEKWLEANLNPGDLAMIMMDVRDEDYAKAATQVKNLGYMELREWTTKDLEKYFIEIYGKNEQSSDDTTWDDELVWEGIEQEISQVARGKKDPKEVAVDIIDLLKKHNVSSYNVKQKFDNMPDTYANKVAKKVKNDIETIVSMVTKRLQ